MTTAESSNQAAATTELDARIEELDQLMRASGQLVPETYADKQGQHVGIASVREIIAKRLRELLDERAKR